MQLVSLLHLMGHLIRLKRTAQGCCLLVFGLILPFYHCPLKDTGSENVPPKVLQI